MERRLAAILAADVVGYSRLMGEDEVGTLERLKALRKELVQPRITERKGRVVKLMGDGLLAEFPSVIEAVQCAVEIQQSMNGRESDLPEDRRIRLRIGVNLGDIIVEGSDIYGDGVNVAARLEALAEPSGICISDVVHQSVDGKLNVKFEDLGMKEIKNIAKPVHIYQIVLDGQSEVSDSAYSRRKGSRLHWVIGAVIITFLAAGGIFAWAASELGQSDSPEAICTDHLGLPVPAEECAENQE